MAKKKTKTKKPSFKAPDFRKWFEDQTVRLALGFGLILIGVFLIGALISYLFNWQSDLSELSGSLWALMTNPELQVDNVFGKFGASTAHVLLYQGFGIAAFTWAYLFVRLGLWSAFDLKNNVGRDVRYALYTLLWLSILLSTFSVDGFLPLGGTGGERIFEMLAVQIGTPGVYLLLFGSLTLFVIIHYSMTYSSLSEAINAFKQKLSSSVSSLKEDLKETEEEQPQEETQVVFDEEVPSAKPAEEKVADSNLEIELDQSVPEPVAEGPKVEATQMEVTPAPKEEPQEELKIEVEEVEEEEELDAKAHKKLIKEVGYYDPKLDLGSFKMPGLDLMKDYGNSNITIDQDELEHNKNRIVETLAHYKIEIAKIKATIGPTVTLYEIVPAPGVRISKIKNLEDDIALSLSAEGIRIIAPIPGKGTIGIEVPNSNPKMVAMRSVLASEKFTKSDMALPIVLGKTISNETYVTDLAKMPHLLMAGATGQGKSVGLNVILTSLLYRKHPSEVKFVLVDPKKVELTLFNVIQRHYLAEMPGNEEAIITDTKKVIYTLNSLCVEMDQRYELLKNAMVRNIKEYNVKFKERRLNPEEGHRFLPYIVLVVDEFADLIMTAGKEVETPIARLAQLARAIGIHLIIATQRPSVNVITGIIKANFPARIAFRVTSKIDSRTILDAGGAERLIGKGDMLISLGSDPLRLQCAFVDTPEIEKLVQFIGNQRGYPTAYQLPEFEGEEGGGVSDLAPEDRDAMFVDAARIIVIHQQGSASLLQRKLKLGYNRAGRIIDQLEAAGIIGPFEGSKARQVLVPDEASLEQILNKDA